MSSLTLSVPGTRYNPYRVPGHVDTHPRDTERRVAGHGTHSREIQRGVAGHGDIHSSDTESRVGGHGTHSRKIQRGVAGHDDAHSSDTESRIAGHGGRCSEVMQQLYHVAEHNDSQLQPVETAAVSKINPTETEAEEAEYIRCQAIHDESKRIQQEKTAKSEAERLEYKKTNTVKYRETQLASEKFLAPDINPGYEYKQFVFRRAKESEERAARHKLRYSKMTPEELRKSLIRRKNRANYKNSRMQFIRREEFIRHHRQFNREINKDVERERQNRWDRTDQVHRNYRKQQRVQNGDTSSDPEEPLRNPSPERSGYYPWTEPGYGDESILPLFNPGVSMPSFDNLYIV